MVSVELWSWSVGNVALCSENVSVECVVEILLVSNVLVEMYTSVSVSKINNVISFELCSGTVAGVELCGRNIPGVLSVCVEEMQLMANFVVEMLLVFNFVVEMLLVSNFVVEIFLVCCPCVLGCAFSTFGFVATRAYTKIVKCIRICVTLKVRLVSSWGL